MAKKTGKDTSGIDQPDKLNQLEQKLTDEVGDLKDQLENASRDREQIEKQFLEAEDRLSLALQSANQGLWEFNLTSGLVDTNDVFFTMLGYDPAEFQMSFDRFREMIHPDDLDNTLAGLNNYISGKANDYRLEFRFRKKDGTYLWILAAGDIVEWNNAGEPVRMLGTHTDITETILTREALVKSENLFKSIVDNTTIGIATVSGEGKPMFTNAAFQDMLGYTAEEFSSMAFPEFTHPDDVDKDMDQYARLMSGEIPSYMMRKRYFHKTGRLVWARLTVSVVRNHSGEILHAIGMVEDITEQRQEELIQEAVVKMHDYALTHSTEESLTMFIDEAERLTDSKFGFYHLVDTKNSNVNLRGWSSNTMKSGCKMDADTEHYPLSEAGIWTEAVHTKKVAIHNDLSERIDKEALPEGHVPLTREMVIPVIRSGEVVAVLAVANKLTPYGSAEQKVLEELADVTWETLQRKTLEEKLQRSELLFRNIFENSPLGISRTDRNGHMIINRVFSSILGYSEEELNNKHWKEITHAEDIRESEHNMNILINEKKQVEFSKRYIHKNGKTVWTDVKSTPQLNENGEVEYMITTIADVTEKRNAEKVLKKTMLELERSNKELEHFAYFASHDLQEPLRKVKNYSELFMSRYRELVDEKGARYLEIVNSGTSRMQRMVDDLLTISRVSTRGDTFTNVDTSIVVEETIESMEMVISQEHAALEFDKLPVVLGDEGQIGQLFQNLISNAIKFRGENPPEINISAQATDEGWEFRVSDNGIGFSADDAHRIFAPFQRLTKTDDRPGSGIGLAICKKIVERHRGTITAESTPGTGSVFTFTLPSARE